MCESWGRESLRLGTDKHFDRFGQLLTRGHPQHPEVLNLISCWYFILVYVIPLSLKVLPHGGKFGLKFSTNPFPRPRDFSRIFSNPAIQPADFLRFWKSHEHPSMPV